MITTHANFVPKTSEKFTLPSKTVPNMAIPLDVLVARYTKGQPIPVFEEVYLDEDSPVPATLERMDPFERMDAARDIKKGISRRLDELKEEQQNTIVETGDDEGVEGVDNGGKRSAAALPE